MGSAKLFIASIKKGALVFVGFDPQDSLKEIKKLSKKLLNYKIFSDVNGRINLSIVESKYEILLIPQITLSVNTKKGLVPSFSQAANHEEGLVLFKQLTEHLIEEYSKVKSGTSHVYTTLAPALSTSSTTWSQPW